MSRNVIEARKNVVSDIIRKIQREFTDLLLAPSEFKLSSDSDDNKAIYSAIIDITATAENLDWLKYIIFSKVFVFKKDRHASLYFLTDSEITTKGKIKITCTFLLSHDWQSSDFKEFDFMHHFYTMPFAREIYKRRHQEENARKRQETSLQQTSRQKFFTPLQPVLLASSDQRKASLDSNGTNELITPQTTKNTP